MEQTFTPDQIAAFMAEMTNHSEDSSSSQPIKVQVGDQTVTFNNEAELSSGLNTVSANYNAAKAEAQQLRQQNAALIAQHTQAGRGSQVSSDDDTPEFSRDEFVDELGRDPLQAINRALNHLVFDGRAGSDAAALLREGLIRGTSAERKLVATQYAGIHPEVVGNNQYANVVEQTRKELGLAFDLNGLEAATAMAERRGQIPDYRQFQQFQQAQQAPPPGMRSGSTPTYQDTQLSEDYLESLSVEQLENLANRMSAPPR